MPKKIVILQGHPDPSQKHFGHALADAYAREATLTGHEVRRVEVAKLTFPLLRSKREWTDGPLPAGLRDAQAAIAWADHVVLIFPLWLGMMPALVKGFLEQVLRPGFAFRYDANHSLTKALKNKSARVIMTMGMPARWYRSFFRAEGLKGMERSILGFCGLRPIRETFIGLVEDKSAASRQKWLGRIGELGRKAA